MSPRDVWAKSRRGNAKALTLAAHCHDAEMAASSLFAEDSRLLHSWCRFFRVDNAARFLLHLRVACLFHDLGKANEDFQAAVRSRQFYPQSLRHEHISALILCLPKVVAWLTASPFQLDTDVITAAVLAHHQKAAERNEHQWCQSRRAPTIQLLLDSPDSREIFERVKILIDAGPLPDLPLQPWQQQGVWLEALKRGRQAAKRFRRCIQKDADRRRFLCAVKAGVVASDSIASAMVREGHSIDEWIQSCAHVAQLTPDELERAIIGPRIESVAKGKTFELRPFQKRASELGNRALLIAGCGSGKTLAAWKWAQKQLGDYALGRIIFLYPTRGTATEGFRDYVGWAPEDEAALVHGSARYELDAILENPPESAQKKRYLAEGDERLYALAQYRKRFFSATVDQFLSFLENRYRSLCMLPLLTDSAVIIDEIHSFSPRMFDDLVRFLKEYDAPVLCMTATLTRDRVKRLHSIGLEVYPTESDRDQLLELQRLEDTPRYRIQPIGSDLEEAIAFALNHLSVGSKKRLLWVVNTVARCQQIAQRLESELGREVITYHSRFRLIDRQRQHAATVNGFQQTNHSAIAVTTQVCEMSLDLDADILVSELAPISSLVQRLGRANRHLAVQNALAGVFIYAPPHHLPYETDELDASRDMFSQLADQDVCQRTLSEGIEAHAESAQESLREPLFLSQGYYATQGDFREGDVYLAPAVLDDDIQKVLGCLHRRVPYDGYVVPVPRRFAEISASPPTGWPRFLGVAKASAYDFRLGFLGDPQ